jgi:hypothetical protein
VFCQGFKRFVGDAHDAPLREHDRALRVVEVYGRLVPDENVPFEPRAALGYGNLGEVLQESFANSLPSKCWCDVEIFEADAVVAAPGAVTGEEEGESGGGAITLGHDAAEARGGAEAVAQEVGFGGEDGVGLALIEGQLMDEGEDLGDVGGGGWADSQGHFMGCSECAKAKTRLIYQAMEGLKPVHPTEKQDHFFAGSGGLAASHLSKGRVKAKSSTLAPFSSVLRICLTYSSACFITGSSRPRVS